MMNSHRFPKYCIYRIGCRVEDCDKQFPKYLTCRQKLLYDKDVKKYTTTKNFRIDDL